MDTSKFAQYSQFQVQKQFNWVMELTASRSIEIGVFQRIRFYCKSSHQGRSSNRMMTSIFSDPTNNTASEVGIEATKDWMNRKLF
ncbi:hypothetical protein CU098_013781, partial [Rhizopus stolonifer]